MIKYGMALDLQRCNGNGACTIACKVEQGTPLGVAYALVKDVEIGKYPKAKRVFLPLICMHCDDPPCMRACPTRAIRKKPEGVVVVDEDVCDGHRACVMACPFGAMFFDEGGSTAYPGAVTPYEESKPIRHKPDMALKCNFCTHRVQQGLNPACVITCPTNARIFGDLDDPASEISKLVASRKYIRLREEIGTEPNIYYLL